MVFDSVVCTVMWSSVQYEIQIWGDALTESHFCVVVQLLPCRFFYKDDCEVEVCLCDSSSRRRQSILRNEFGVEFNTLTFSRCFRILKTSGYNTCVIL